MRSNENLSVEIKWLSGLGKCVLKLQRLPPCQVVHEVASLSNDKWGVNWLIRDIRIFINFIRAILLKKGPHAESNAVTQSCRRRISLIYLHPLYRITELSHASHKTSLSYPRIYNRSLGVLHRAVAVGQCAIGSITEGLVSCCLQATTLRNHATLSMNISQGFFIEGTPSIPHGDGNMEQIARMHGWIGKRQTNRLEVLFVPYSGHGLLRPDNGEQTHGQTRAKSCGKN